MASRAAPFASLCFSIPFVSVHKFCIGSSKLNFRLCFNLVPKLREKFEQKSKNSKVPLFKCFEVYESSLPVRRCDDEFLKLYEQPYFVHPEDISHGK